MSNLDDFYAGMPRTPNDISDMFTDVDTGIPNYLQNVQLIPQLASQGSMTLDQWYTLLDVTGPGVVTKCIFRNDTSGTADMQLRVTIDGEVLVDETISVSTSENTNFWGVIVGVRQTQVTSPGTYFSVYPSPLHFKSGFKVEIKQIDAATITSYLRSEYYLTEK